MAPRARNKFGVPSSNLRSFGNKCTALKKVLATLLRLFGVPQCFRSPAHCQARNQGGAQLGEVSPYKIVLPPGKMCWAQVKTIGQSLKNLGPSQKTLRHPWCPKLVTGLVIVPPLAPSPLRSWVVAVLKEFHRKILTNNVRSMHSLQENYIWPTCRAKNCAKNQNLWTSSCLAIPCGSNFSKTVDSILTNYISLNCSHYSFKDTSRLK